MRPRARRFLRHWTVASALVLCLAAFGYSPYAFPDAIHGDTLALAYEVRWVFLMSTLYTFGPAGSIPEFGGKLLLTILFLWALIPALLGLLLPVARRP
jgi:hypothetical protein